MPYGGSHAARSIFRICARRYLKETKYADMVFELHYVGTLANFELKRLRTRCTQFLKNVVREKRAKQFQMFFRFKEIKTPAFHKQKAQLTLNVDQARCHILFVSGNSAPHYFSSTSRGLLEVDLILILNSQLFIPQT